jgi:acetyl-CoA C-acetyltransferase/acetyl-CoA acyltransferase
VIIDGVRTPFAKADTALAGLSAQELGRIALRELLDRTAIDPALLDEVIVGNVAQPAEATNIARVIALRAGVPQSVPAYTVNRNCASGLQSLVDAALRVQSGAASLVAAGGTESMSSIPVYFPESYRQNLFDIARARSVPERVAKLARFRPADFKPVIALEVGLTDDVCGLNMGNTAELLAKEFGISREAQDRFALGSHERALAAQDRKLFDVEIVPVPVAPAYTSLVTADQGPRRNQSLEALARLKPYFDRRFGTVTVGNSCPITDGAAMLLVASESRARELGLKPLAAIRSWSFAGLDPARMGLGPVFATPAALRKGGMRLGDIDLIEMNEAFAAQVLANATAFDSADFARRHLGQAEPVGTLDMARLNVNGGAIALGHPVGATGSRLAITLLREMERRNAATGLVTLCVGGGQGAALVLERLG